jgi:hypothetical protein
MTNEERAELIDLDVTGVKEFKIVVEASGDAPAHYNIGNWAAAKFYSDVSQEPVNLASIYYVRKGMRGDLPNVLINPTINSVKYYGKVYLSYNNPSVGTVNLNPTTTATVSATATLPGGATATLSVPVMIIPRYLKYFYDPGDSSTTWADIRASVNRNGWTMGNTSAWPTNVATGANTGWYATNGTATTCNAVGSTSGNGITGGSGLFTSMLHTTANNSKLGFNFRDVTNGTTYTVHMGYQNPWGSRTNTTWSNVATAVTGTLGQPPYDASTGVSQGSDNLNNTTARYRTFSVVAANTQIRVGIFCSGNQPMVSFIMLEENRTDPTYTVTLAKPAAGVSAYSAPFTSGTTTSVTSGDRAFFNVTLQPVYYLAGASATGGAVAEVVGDQIVVTNITANTTISLAVVKQGGGLSVSLISSGITGDGVSVEAFCGTYDAVNGKAMLAVYDGAGRLVAVSPVDFSVEQMGTIIVKNAIQAAIPASGAIKLFFWDDSYVPLCKTVTVR